nr:PREDICTED: tight junction protein ZO-3-like [Opisthocomus hoazin]
MDRLRLCVHACARLLALNEFFPQIIQETSKSSLQKTLHASGQSLVKRQGCVFPPRRKDHIVMVNGLSMENVSSSFAIQTLKTCGKTANIVSVPRGGTGASVAHGTALCLSPSQLPCPTQPVVPVWGLEIAVETSPGRDSCTHHPLLLIFHLQTLKRSKKVHLPASKSSPASPAAPRRCDSDEDCGLHGADPALHRSRDDLDHSQGYDGDSSSERSSGHHRDDRRHHRTRTEGTLTLLVLRDHRQFLVNIRDVEDSQSDSSRMDDISDIDSELSHPPYPVNDTSFQNLTREEALEYLMRLPPGKDVTLRTQSKQDIYRKVISSSVGDSFYIRTHFDFEKDTPSGLSFVRGDVFHVLDTMYRGRLGSWLAARVGRDLQEQDKGIIPNQSSGHLGERPVVILGPIADIAMQKLSTELPELFEIAPSVPRDGASSKVIKLDSVRQIAEKDKHALLDITPSAVERLNYVQYYPVVVFCQPESRQGIKAMRQWLAPDSRKTPGQGEGACEAAGQAPCGHCEA